jgi:ketol-acid reductoisomerase
VAEHQAGRGRYQSLKKRDIEHPIETVGQRLRASMSWLQESAKPKATTAAATATAG